MEVDVLPLLESPLLAKFQSPRTPGAKRKPSVLAHWGIIKIVPVPVIQKSMRLFAKKEYPSDYPNPSTRGGQAHQHLRPGTIKVSTDQHPTTVRIYSCDL